MAKTNEIHVKAKRFKDRPVCVTLHNGETYIGYISGVSNEGVELTGGGKLTQTPTSPARKTVAARSNSPKMKPRATGANKNASSPRRKKVNRSRKSSASSRITSRRTSRQAQVSSFMPMMGSLLGGLGGAGSFGGMLGGGMRLFGMIQRFVPVVKMGYGMIKQIQPFMGAVQGLMSPASQAQENEDEAEGEIQRG